MNTTHRPKPSSPHRLKSTNLFGRFRAFLAFGLTTLYVSSPALWALTPPPPPAEVEASLGSSSYRSHADSDLIEAAANPDPSSVIIVDKTGASDARQAFDLGPTPPPPPSDFTDAALESVLSIDVSTYYFEKDLVPTRTLCKSGALSYSYTGTYATDSGIYLLGNLSYTSLLDKVADNLHDPLTLSLGIRDEVIPNLFVSATYGLHYGGISGLYAHDINGQGDSIVQDIKLSLEYNFLPSAFFAGIDLIPSFYGITGTYVHAKVGYNYEFAPYFHMIASTGTTVNLGYWAPSGLLSYFVDISFPFVYSDNIVIRPYVQMNILGEAGRRLNDQASSPLFRSFSAIFGLKLEWSF